MDVDTALGTSKLLHCENPVLSFTCAPAADPSHLGTSFSGSIFDNQFFCPMVMAENFELPNIMDSKLSVYMDTNGTIVGLVSDNAENCRMQNKLMYTSAKLVSVFYIHTQQRDCVTMQQLVLKHVTHNCPLNHTGVPSSVASSDPTGTPSHTSWDDSDGSAMMFHPAAHQRRMQPVTSKLPTLTLSSPLISADSSTPSTRAPAVERTAAPEMSPLMTPE